MEDFFLGEPPLYTGSQEKDHETLVKAIKEQNQSYDKMDPRTWLCVQHDTGVAATFSYSPLMFVAYKRSCIEPYTNNVCFPGKLGGSTGFMISVGINWRFRHYPFNFNNKGELRDEVGMTKNEFEEWMVYVNGPEWTTKYPRSAPEPQTKVTLKKERIDSDSSMTGVVDDGDIMPDDIYESIMNNINEQKGASSNATALEAELQMTKAQLAVCENEQRKTKELLKKTNRSLEQEKKTAKEHKEALDKVEKARDFAKKISDDVIKTLKENNVKANKAAEECKRALEDTKQKLASSKKQLENIWREIRNMRHGQSLKREADDDVVGEQDKRAKMN